MEQQHVLVIGGGIGGLTAAIALARDGHQVSIVEQNTDASVYGVGIIQQANVVRAMAQLDLLEDYLGAGIPFETVAIHEPGGRLVAEIRSPQLVEGYPPNLGISRRALQKILLDRAVSLGVEMRFGTTATSIENGADKVRVILSDGRSVSFDLIVGADGIYSATRGLFFPDAPKPTFTGQAVWRYNLPRPAALDALHVYNGPTGVGLVPMSDERMYLFATTAEPGNPHYPLAQRAAVMRRKLRGTASAIEQLAAQIVDDSEVVYRPLEYFFLDGPWHCGRIVLLGDAVHATTPHLGQGGGMAIEDSVVLAEAVAAASNYVEAFEVYQARRYARCKFICEQSLAICHGQLGKGPLIDNGQATAAMIARTAEPI